jgi:hypothetical protein
MKVFLSIPDEGYSRNTSCRHNYISTFYYIMSHIFSFIIFEHGK